MCGLDKKYVNERLKLHAQVSHFCAHMLQDLQQSQSREVELQASADEFQRKLAKEVGLCRDLTSDLNRMKAELAGVQGDLEERAEESEALSQQVQQLQVCGCNGGNRGSGGLGFELRKGN